MSILYVRGKTVFMSNSSSKGQAGKDYLHIWNHFLPLLLSSLIYHLLPTNRLPFMRSLYVLPTREDADLDRKKRKPKDQYGNVNLSVSIADIAGFDGQVFHRIVIRDLNLIALRLGKWALNFEEVDLGSSSMPDVDMIRNGGLMYFIRCRTAFTHVVSRSKALMFEGDCHQRFVGWVRSYKNMEEMKPLPMSVSLKVPIKHYSLQTLIRQMLEDLRDGHIINAIFPTSKMMHNVSDYIIGRYNSSLISKKDKIRAKKKRNKAAKKNKSTEEKSLSPTSSLASSLASPSSEEEANPKEGKRTCPSLRRQLDQVSALPSLIMNFISSESAGSSVHSAESGHLFPQTLGSSVHSPTSQDDSPEPEMKSSSIPSPIPSPTKDHKFSYPSRIPSSSATKKKPTSSRRTTPVRMSRGGGLWKCAPRFLCIDEKVCSSVDFFNDAIILERINAVFMCPDSDKNDILKKRLRISIDDLFETQYIIYQRIRDEKEPERMRNILQYAEMAYDNSFVEGAKQYNCTIEEGEDEQEALSWNM